MIRRSLVLRLAIVVLVMLSAVSAACSSGAAPPTAAFTVSYVSGELLIADPIAGTVPLTVQFTDQSAGKITSWRWNFGDGQIIEGSDDEYQNPTHVYRTCNVGYIVVLTVRGPGGKDVKEVSGIVTVMMCSEAANSELVQAKTAIESCLSAAGKTKLDMPVTGWDGTRGKVTAGGRDAADYLGIWKTFKGTYDIDSSGTITHGTDVSWGCVEWAMSITGPRWRGTAMH